jgi:hypothetical protein
MAYRHPLTFAILWRPARSFPMFRADAPTIHLKNRRTFTLFTKHSARSVSSTTIHHVRSRPPSRVSAWKVVNTSLAIPPAVSWSWIWSAHRCQRSWLIHENRRELHLIDRVAGPHQGFRQPLIHRLRASPCSLASALSRSAETRPNDHCAGDAGK